MTIPKNSNPMTELEAILKDSNPKIQKFITAFETENLKLHKQIAKLEVENISLKNRVKSLEEYQPELKLNINLPDKPKIT